MCTKKGFSASEQRAVGPQQPAVSRGPHEKMGDAGNVGEDLSVRNAARP